MKIFKKDIYTSLINLKDIYIFDDPMFRVVGV